MQKKILFFIQAALGGAERVSVAIANHMATSGFQVGIVLVGEESGAEMLKTSIGSKIPITLIAKTNAMTMFRALRYILDANKPSFVFSSVFHLNTKLLLLAPLYKNTRFIVRNNIGLYRLSTIQKIIVWISYQQADKIICQTQEMQDEFARFCPRVKKKLITLTNPLNTLLIDRLADAPSPYTSTDCTIYVAAARFTKIKGFHVLVDAFNFVRQKDSNAQLYLLGRNNTEWSKQIYERIEYHNLTSAVHCPGVVSNPYKYFKNATCFVLPSLNEGLPNVLIEALHVGTPVASTTCIPVIERIVSTGTTGYLCEPNNPMALADAMLKAAKLGRIQSTYPSNSLEDFEELFK